MSIRGGNQEAHTQKRRVGHPALIVTIVFHPYQKSCNIPFGVSVQVVCFQCVEIGRRIARKITDRALRPCPLRTGEGRRTRVGGGTNKETTNDLAFRLPYGISN